MSMDTGARVHVERAGAVSMALSAEEAFPLFSAEGERRWVAGWNPSYLHPVEPGAGEGVVFQTVKKDLGTATWVQTRHEPGAGFASFVCIVPDHHAAMVGRGCNPRRREPKPSVREVSHDVLVIGCGRLRSSVRRGLRGLYGPLGGGYSAPHRGWCTTWRRVKAEAASGRTCREGHIGSRSIRSTSSASIAPYWFSESGIATSDRYHTLMTSFSCRRADLESARCRCKRAVFDPIPWEPNEYRPGGTLTDNGPRGPSSARDGRDNPHST